LVGGYPGTAIGFLNYFGDVFFAMSNLSTIASANDTSSLILSIALTASTIDDN
jgi:hypothetical protein